MVLIFLSLIQIQQRYILLIAGAVILALAVTLVIYFRKRMKRVEKEAQEDWNLGMQSLFIKPPAQASAEPTAGEQNAGITDEVAPASDTPLEAEGFDVEATPLDVPVAHQPEPVAPEDKETSVTVEHTQLLHSEPGIYSEPGIGPPVETPSQEIAAENAIESAETETRGETVSLGANQTSEAVFDEEVWSQLETAELRSPQSESINEQAEEAAPPVEQATEPLSFVEPPEPSRDAHIEHRARRAPFEPPRIEPISHREPFEPPTVEPLTPRARASFMRERSTQSQRPQDERETIRREDRPVRSSPVVIPHRDREKVAESDEREIPAAYTGAPADRVTTAPPIESVRVRKTPAGSVLGLPSESSDKPLVLGEPVRSADDAGIEALSRYGSRPKEKTSHAGTIALLIILLLIGGIIGAYFVVPAFRNWVDSTYAGMRGKPPEDKSPKARIAGYSPMATNNMARAGGVVENISNETLEGLAVEVTLRSADGAVVETRTMNIEPPVLAPGERGRFEIEYPIQGTVLQATVTRLTGSSGQIIFTTNQR